MAEYRNCPNCAAPYDVKLNTCPYCGTSYFDMAAVKLGGKPIILKFCLDELVRMHGPAGVLTAKAFISNATMHEEVMPGIPDRDLEGRLLLKAAARRTLTLEFALLDFIEEQDEMP